VRALRGARGRRSGRRPALLAAGAGALALIVAGVSGWYPYAQLAPGRPEAVLRPGAHAEVDGVRYGLDRFEVAASLPAQDPKDPPVRGPEGSVLVLVVVTQTVLDRGVTLDDHFCDATLVDAAGSTVWQTDSDFTSLAARPAAYGCAGSGDAPLRYDQPQQVGFSFVVPAAEAEGVEARLQVSDGPTLALRR
jgi:hypothetical protein